MLGRSFIRIFIIGILLSSSSLFAQVDFNITPNDDLGNFEDKFQEAFFEALKQRGIENYDRAISSLLTCLKFDDSKSVIYFELGKNYVQVQNYGAAKEAFQRAIAIDPGNEWYLDELYGVYIQQDDYDNALKTVQQLVQYHPDYKEDLANLYFRYDKFKEALDILDELDKKLGVSESRDRLRNDIYNATGADNDRIENLEKRLAGNPDNEDNYLNLIYRYSENGDTKKAFEIAKQLLQKKPKSQLVHLALYKFYLDDDQPKLAVESMKKVLKSGTIRPDAKTKVLNDFIFFVRSNPKYEDQLLEVTTEVVEDESGKSDAELAQYYLQKNDKEKALAAFERAFEKEPSNFNILKNVLLLKIDVKQFESAVVLSKEALDSYPAQPILYLINGVANNNLNQPKKAIDALELGVDYIIDDVQMEADFYKQLSLAYQLDNNITKSEAFSKKAADLLNEND